MNTQQPPLFEATCDAKLRCPIPTRPHIATAAAVPWLVVCEYPNPYLPARKQNNPCLRPRQSVEECQEGLRIAHEGLPNSEGLVRHWQNLRGLQQREAGASFEHSGKEEMDETRSKHRTWRGGDLEAELKDEDAGSRYEISPDLEAQLYPRERRLLDPCNAPRQRRGAVSLPHNSLTDESSRASLIQEDFPDIEGQNERWRRDTTPGSLQGQKSFRSFDSRPSRRSPELWLHDDAVLADEGSNGAMPQRRFTDALWRLWSTSDVDLEAQKGGIPRGVA